ncbi:hypothetical protein JOC25_000082 [Solibacillus kalamii]|uniref:Lipoprotein n=1 Tax=Solibacillus kalamii TaxID=1748298 RepID=A0ABX3ZHB4_9BACL|nr:hypothetical protein [Solibacillus kalamii]MBM7663626.1 hypothetical protein [Solibacillus kalamii]OUZ39116.1 hypothetical protein CBM15_09640 [Solibacillus kalamii]
MNELKKIKSLCLVFFLAACQSATSSAYIVEAEVVEAFQRNKMNLVEIHTPEEEEEDIFGSKLKGVKPGAYQLKEKLVFIYEFDTAADRENGKRVFVEKTASMNLVSYSQFEKQNILIFYLHGGNLNPDNVLFEKEIQEALDSLVEG